MYHESSLVRNFKEVIVELFKKMGYDKGVFQAYPGAIKQEAAARIT